MRMQASLLATAALTAEVGTLKQGLERSEQELGLAKRQLEEKEGKRYLIEKIYKKDAIAKMTGLCCLLQGPQLRWLPSSRRCRRSRRERPRSASSERNLRRRLARRGKSFRLS